MLGENGSGEDERRNLVETFHHLPPIIWLSNRPDSLLSFGKFLELLVYSPSLQTITPPLCEHTVPVEGDAVAALSRSGANVARHFIYRAHRVTFTKMIVEEIYNIQVPRVQFVHGVRVPEEAKHIADPQTVSSQCTTLAEPEAGDVKRILKREMRTWWHALSERIDNLVGFSLPCFPPDSL